MTHEKMRGICLIIALLAAAFLPFILLSENAEAQPRAPHNPIDIRDDAGFLSPSNGVTRGTGREDDPFIIENWEINSPVINGIYIENTQAYVVIRNVWTHRDNWAVDYNGIVISNAEHITIEDCESTDNWIGIVIGSSDVTLKNNIINDNNHGVSLNYGSRESIPKMEGNLVNGINIDGTINEEEQCYFYNENDLVFDGKVEKCESEGYTGGLTYQGILTLYDCENFIIKNCQLENNAIGILLGHSNGTITDNLILNNTWFIAVECYSSSPLIARNNISHNGCGGIHCSGGSSPHIRDNYIGYNTAGTGYGIRMMDADSNPIIENNMITGHRPHDG
ncbi:MAG: right-handed parallel beta-helix repeat-containing protein, partial [Thermoplasmata archaeon]|nr:right-handed parallel beta-helix repeat-containing protein [Thermoplasmata archaeon]